MPRTAKSLKEKVLNLILDMNGAEQADVIETIGIIQRRRLQGHGAPAQTAGRKPRVRKPRTPKTTTTAASTGTPQ